MASEYIHKVLTIRLRFESPDVKKKELNISSPASGDWDKKLSSLLSKIAKKFKLSDMNASEWTISINNTIIDKSDANQLKQVLSLIPPKPIPIVEIIKTIKSEKFYIITVHYEEKQFYYKIKKETDESEWDEEIYQQLQAAILTEFELDSEFVLYQNIGGTEIEIDDVDDLTDALYDTPDEQATSTQLLHLFVKVQQPQIDKNALKIIYENNSFDWRPANNEGDDEKEWEDNYTTLINKINSEYFINNIKLQQMQNAVDIDDGEELMEAWQELVDDEDNYILEIRISGDSIFWKITIKNELEGDCTNGTKPEEGEYKQWFRDVLGLPQYYQQFVDAGYDNLNCLDEYIDEDELMNDMGIKKKPHRRRILRGIKKLLQKTNINLTNVANVGQSQFDVKKEPIKQSEKKPIADRNDIEPKEPDNDGDDDKDKELEFEEKEEMSMEEELSRLGSKIGSLPSKKQKLCHKTITSIKDMEKMKAVRKMRKDPSCLLSRVLCEISLTVCIQVSSAELYDFGVMKMESMGDDQAYEDDDDGIETITFCLEETKENHIMCQAADTNIVPLKQNSKKHGEDCDDLFILNGIYLSGYVRLFTQKHSDTKTWTKTWTNSSKNPKKLYEEIKLLDSKWKIEWDKNLSNAENQKHIIVEAILPAKYQQYKNDKKELRKQKMKELNDSVLEKEAETILESREKLISNEYCNLYINRCKSSHKKLITIINELGDSLWSDLYAVIGYIDMEYKKVTLKCTLDYNEKYWQKRYINELFNGMERILRIHKREIEEVHRNCEKIISETKEEKKPKCVGDKIWENVRSRGVFVERDEEEIRLSKMTKVEWDSRLKLKIDAAVNKAQRLTLKQHNVTIQQWLDRFQSKYNEYKNKVYSSFLSKYKIKNNVKSKITKINQQRLDKLEENLFQQFKVYQNKKKRNKNIATINKISISNTSYWNSQSPTRYDLEYCIPKTIPPTYDMQFHTIDLATFDIEEMKISQQQNMNYEMPQTSKLLFHHVIGNEVIMFIRTDNEENKSSETRIVVSNNSTLTSDSVRMALKRKRVINVTFFEKQKIFAILFEDELKFSKLHDGGRVAFTEKGCDLSETTAWWHSDIVIDAVLMQQDDNNNLFVWFVDSKHYLRAFDYDTNDWEPSKDFNLDQKYNSYILSPEGSFLVAFKPQYEEDEIYTPGNEPLIVEQQVLTEPDLPEPGNEEKQTVDPDDELEPKDEQKNEKIELKSDDKESKSNDEAKEEPIARTATGRIQLHVFLLAEKRKLTYKIHSNSLTGYETGFEQELKDDNRDDLDIADNVLLPPEFSIGNVHLDRLSIQSTTKKDTVMLCAVNSSNKLLLHPLHIQLQISEKLKIKTLQVKHLSDSNNITIGILKTKS